MIGEKIIKFKTIESTNTYALGLSAQENCHGTVIVADQQTAGRGQYGRTWSTGENDSLLMSVILHPPPELKRPVYLIAWAAIALGEAIFTLTGLQARIKWPNDLLIQGKKVSGILTESANQAVVVGMGCNLNQSSEYFSELNLPQATSLLCLTQKSYERDTVLTAVIEQFNRAWDQLLDGELEPLESVWKWRVGLLGSPIEIEQYDGTKVAGRLIDMTFDAIEVANDTGGIDILKPESIRQMRGL